MKKHVAAGLGILLAASLALGGCGNTSSSGNAPVSDEAAAEAENMEDTESGTGEDEKPDPATEPQGPGGQMPGEGGPGEGGPGGGGPGEGGPNQSGSNIEYNALVEYDSDADESETDVESTETDEIGILVKSGNVKLTDYAISRDSDDSTGGDEASFYGVGAAVLNTGGTLELNDSEINTDAKGGAGVFSYGENAVTTVNSTKIYTRQDTSGGIHVAGGGTLYANNVTAETNGESSAAIRSDRGGGLMVIDGGRYASNGTGSPAIYSTANISASNADLIATNSEAVCVEGKNSVDLTDCYLTGNMPDDDRNDCTWNIILYQSMSGDAEEGKSTFQMNGGTIEQGNGGIFYTTNTQSEIILRNVGIITSEDNDFLLKCTGNSNERGWGATGENGAKCNFAADEQTLTGDVIWDSISELDMYLAQNSYFWGAVRQDESNAGAGGNGYCTLNIGSGCQWIVTGDSYLTYLNNAGDIIDSDGNYVTIVDSEGNVIVEGDSRYVVQVEGYSNDPDMSGAAGVNVEA